jgi:hypothetical protein
MNPNRSMLNPQMHGSDEDDDPLDRIDGENVDSVLTKFAVESNKLHNKSVQNASSTVGHSKTGPL